MNRQAIAFGYDGKQPFLETVAVAIASAAVVPPSCLAFAGKFGSVTAESKVDEAGVVVQHVDAVRRNFSKLFQFEIVIRHRTRFPAFPLLLSRILEVPDQFFFLQSIDMTGNPLSMKLQAFSSIKRNWVSRFG